VLSCVTLITLDTRNGRTGSLGAMGRIAHRIVSPSRGGRRRRRPVSDWWDGIVNSGNLKRDNRRLQEQIAALLGKQTAADEAIKGEQPITTRSLAAQNALLVKKRDRADRRPRSGQLRPTLTIDKGRSGISVDYAVIAPEGIVGKGDRRCGTRREDPSAH